MNLETFDPEPVLGRLKDFQRRTVEHVFHRLYLAPDAGKRFLVADEVGLGKTLVARGVIARTLAHLRATVKRIDIVYICSNATIAAQNIDRLNLAKKRDFAVSTRLTLLAEQVHQLDDHRVNFISFTPGTTFDLKSRGGVKQERLLLFRMLRDLDWIDAAGLERLLRLGVGDANWAKACRQAGPAPDSVITTMFREAVEQDEDLRRRLIEDCALLARTGEVDRTRCQHLVGDLRNRLAKASVDALEPDLVILDEFQRFRDLLDGEDEAAELARALFHFKDVRVLLLSATPYKMLSLHHEADEDHHRDFLRTLGFLLDDPVRIEAVREELQRFRGCLQGAVTGDGRALHGVRDRLQAELSRVMCRTERVAVTASRNAMLQDRMVAVRPSVSDLRQARFGGQVGDIIGTSLPIEYWKSTPYPLNFLRDYQFRRRFDREARSHSGPAVQDALTLGRKNLLDFRKMRRFNPIDLGNARLRDLAEQTLDREMWRLLWMPPSLAYWQPEGAYADVGSVTKKLVFSSWNAVPDAIAALLSYEAERLMLAGVPGHFDYTELHRKMKGLLRFARKDGHLSGMTTLAMVTPFPTLASEVDPVRIAIEAGEDGPPSLDQVREVAEERVRQLLGRLPDPPGDDGFPDRRWYWAAPLLLEARTMVFRDWCMYPEEADKTGSDSDDDEPGLFGEHLALAARTTRGLPLEPPLGRRPADLVTVLTQMALAAPGVVALRALNRVAGLESMRQRVLLQCAFRCAQGLRSLFNQPDVVALLKGTGAEDGAEGYYWRTVLQYALQGNLQAVLDEQAHVLVESLGVQDADAAHRLDKVSQAIADAASIRASSTSVDFFPGRTPSPVPEPQRIRCRFAMRFAELKDEESSTVVRSSRVRAAFNSPFRPFVLATTSVGQEGLDFHTWCHSVVHWNLPSNPVDLEQREGRVHRFKGHAIRKNVAARHGLEALRGLMDEVGDPWVRLFERAAQDREAGVSELVPYWIFEIPDGDRVERRVPVLAFSRDEARMQVLRRSLAVYRLVFGQPRQEDLLQFLARTVPGARTQDLLADWHLRLEPGGI